MPAAEIVARLSELVRDRRRERASAAESAAAALRDLIVEGALAPGARVAEEALLEPLDVSRNTLREAFRLLTHERLLVHKLNRGVFVRALDAADVVDLFRARRVIEAAGVERAGPAGAGRMAEAVAEGERAAEQGRWADVGAADLRFHQAVVAEAGSGHLDELMRGIGAELRLGFHEMGDPAPFHERCLRRDRGIVDALRRGERAEASTLLRELLDDAEQEMLAVFEREGR